MPKKTTSVYRPVLRKAWQITWQNKFLWIFGILAALAGNAGIYEILTKNFYKISEKGELGSAGINWFLTSSIFFEEKLETFFAESPFLIVLSIIILITLFVIFLAVVWLSIVGKGALLHCAKKISKKEKTDLKDGWKAGNKFFWPVLGINLLAKALIFAFLFLISIPTILFLTGRVGGWNLFIYIVSFIIFTALALLISFLAVYASCYIVIGKQKFSNAIARSWNLFAKNWLISIEMALILFIISLGVGIVLIIFLALLAIPFVLLLTIFDFLALELGFWFTIVLAVLVWLVFLVFVGAWLTTFQYTSWSLLFIELNKKKILSKLLRFIGIK